MADENVDPIYTTYGAPVVSTQPQGITTLADDLLSAYEPIVFDVTWAGDSEPNHLVKNKRVRAKVYVGATPVLMGKPVKTSITVSATTVYRFNLSEIMQTMLSPEFYNNIGADTINTGNENLVVPFYIEFTALFRDQNNWDREDLTLTTGTYYATNGIIRETETNKVFDKGVSDYILGTTSSKFLTRSPNQLTIYPNEDYQLSFFTAEGDTHRIAYEKFDRGGASLGVSTTALVDCTTSKHGTLTVTDNTLLDGVPTETQSRVDVWIRNSSGTQISEKFRFDVNYNCSSSYRLWWHNSLGGIDKYTFRAYNNETYEQTQRINIDSPLNTTVSTTDFQTITIATSGKKMFKAVTEILTEGLEMFVDLINSTEVYLQKDTSSSALLPVNILNTSQTVEDSDGLIQVEVEFELSQTHKTHIR